MNQDHYVFCVQCGQSIPAVPAPQQVQPSAEQVTQPVQPQVVHGEQAPVQQQPQWVQLDQIQAAQPAPPYEVQPEQAPVFQSEQPQVTQVEQPQTVQLEPPQAVQLEQAAELQPEQPQVQPPQETQPEPGQETQPEQPQEVELTQLGVLEQYGVQPTAPVPSEEVPYLSQPQPPEQPAIPEQPTSPVQPTYVPGPPAPMGEPAAPALQALSADQPVPLQSPYPTDQPIDPKGMPAVLPPAAIPAVPPIDPKGMPAVPPPEVLPAPQPMAPLPGDFPPPQPMEPPAGTYPTGHPSFEAPAKKRTPLIVKILIPVLAVIVILAGVVLLASLITGNEAQADYYTIGTDRVPSVKFVLDEVRDIRSTVTETTNGITTKTIIFAPVDVNQSAEMKKYATYLYNNGFYALVDIDFSGPTGLGTLGRNSVDPGMKITVNIYYDDEGYVLTLVKQKGEIVPDDPGTDPTDGPKGAPSDAPTGDPTIRPAPGWERDNSKPMSYHKGESTFSITIVDLSDFTGTVKDYAQNKLDNHNTVGAGAWISELLPGSVGSFQSWQYVYVGEDQVLRCVVVGNLPSVYEIEAISPWEEYNEQAAEEIQMMIDSFRLA